MLFALLLLRAEATEVGVRVVPCPMGTGTARVYEKRSTNAMGGWDSDFASYASGGQWRTFEIATCDDGLFTLYGRDMGTPVPEADRPKLQAALDAAVAKLSSREDPPVWERYGIAAALYAAMGRDDEFLGDLWLEASWTARDEAVGYYAGLEGPVEARKLLDAGWEELKKPLSTADRKKVLYNLARVAHRGGWATERDAMLAAFEAAGPMDDAERAAVARFRRIAGTVEPALQDEAIAHYRKALAAGLEHDARVHVAYTLADLLRRRGQDEEALELFFVVANDQKADEHVRGLALFLAQQVTPTKH